MTSIPFLLLAAGCQPTATIMSAGHPATSMAAPRIAGSLTGRPILAARLVVELRIRWLMPWRPVRSWQITEISRRLRNLSNPLLTGFLIATLKPAPPVYDPGGPSCDIDDFAVTPAARWPTTGVRLSLRA
jgi:hypothetical protein